MAIQINEDWRVTGDAPNVTLERRTIAKDGKNAGQERWIAEGFYPNVLTAYAGCANKRVNVALDSEFWQVCKVQREIMAEIKELANG